MKRFLDRGSDGLTRVSVFLLHVWRCDGDRLEALLTGRTPVWERELSCQCNDLAPIPTWGRVWAAQREQPLRVGGLPQVQLWAAEMRLDAARILHRFDALAIGRQVECILVNLRALRLKI